ncbi:MAG: sigma 54-interacting transcriptional regulator [Oscillospiraceae bacterium]|nr:sigma 54-interacting transcriptional regulator [Oscillospiraceae bacterium]
MTREERIRLSRLTLQDYEDIVNHCNSNIFVTDGKGKIIYVNDAAERALNCPAAKLMSMDVYQLRDGGYTTHSSSDDAIRSRKRAVSVYENNLGERIATTSIPILDERGNIAMVVTHSAEVGQLVEFQEELKRYQELAKSYRDAVDYIDSSNSADIIARDPTMIYILQTMAKLARSDSTIMLYGESGVGKEVMANYIRQNSRRKDDIFVPINCAAIPSELIESELFGYDKGAFTGARKEGKAGIFEIADGGTIFLDEIGELPIMAQSKLLRVLEGGEFMRVGGSSTLRTNVRIIGATNRDLKKMVKENNFRADLYYRLNVIPVIIPPLRDRPLDIDALSDSFLRAFNRKHGEHRVISNRMRSWMHEYGWPGNIRELRNLVERYVITNEEYLPVHQQDEVVDGGDGQGDMCDLSRPLRDVVGETEWKYIQAVLKDCGGEVAKAALQLGIHRSVLYKKIDKYKSSEE